MALISLEAAKKWLRCEMTVGCNGINIGTAYDSKQDIIDRFEKDMLSEDTEDQTLDDNQ